MDKIKFITTPLYYVNADPHIGHAYTQVAADTLSRYYRMTGRKAHFLTGTDEHGEKIARAAKENSCEVTDFVDKGVEKYKKLWEKLDIKYDQFIRTTDEAHVKTVEKVINELVKKGYIYKGKYEGWYCVPCESFFTPTQIEEQFCPDCKRKVEKLSQESYFFKLSVFQKKILEHIKNNPSFIQPESRKNEITGFLSRPLRDLSISRLDVSWGIPFPEDDKHTVYVWFDALLNYISAPGYFSDPHKFKELWPADVQLLGKDIIKFHAVIWPAILLALDLELPKTVFAHGWWTVEGEKMSKSFGNVIDPFEVVGEWGADPLRYFLLKQVTFGLDGDFSFEQFKSRYESELANELGNLLSRVLSMIGRYNPEYTAGSSDGFEELANSVCKEIDELYISFKYNIILDRIWDIVRFANIYVEKSKPWELAKKDMGRLSVVLTNLFEVLKVISALIYPFMPAASLKMREQMGIKKLPDKDDLRWKLSGDFSNINKGELLFPKK